MISRIESKQKTFAEVLDSAATMLEEMSSENRMKISLYLLAKHAAVLFSQGEMLCAVKFSKVLQAGAVDMGYKSDDVVPYVAALTASLTMDLQTCDCPNCTAARKAK